MLPLDMLPALSVEKEGRGEPAFVPVAVMPEPEVALVMQVSTVSVPDVEVPVGIMTVELRSGVVVRVPGDVAVERAAALVRALQDQR